MTIFQLRIQPIQFSNLQCYVGDTADKAKANTRCAANEDRCYTKTEGDVVMTKCFAIENLEDDKMTDKDCKMDSDINICLCDTDNCNNPTG